MQGASGQRFGITVTGYHVGSWCPTPDGSGEAEAVAIQIMICPDELPRPLQEEVLPVQDDVEPPVGVEIDEDGASARDTLQSGFPGDVDKVRGEKE